MKLETSLTAEELVEKLELPEDTKKAVWKLIEDYWQPRDEIEFNAEVDQDQAYDAVDDAGLIPDAELDEVIDTDQLVDAVKAVLDGDLSTALLLFGRFLGNADNDAQRRIEQLIYDRKRRKADSGLPAVARAA